jgi:hypothetical protein
MRAAAVGGSPVGQLEAHDHHEAGWASSKASTRVKRACSAAETIGRVAIIQSLPVDGE